MFHSTSAALAPPTGTPQEPREAQEAKEQQEETDVSEQLTRAMGEEHASLLRVTRVRGCSQVYTLQTDWSCV